VVNRSLVASPTKVMESYFLRVGLRVAKGASDIESTSHPIWQVGPASGDHLHVLEFKSRSAVWKWWREMVTSNDESCAAGGYRRALLAPGWVRRALILNSELS
jgi:hypothetical protein